ncbi:MAG: hypothetical protein ACPLKS_08270, partial [Caldisericum exile]|uniref:hypothetical protein n=1 Tax=Caldisericum exile TaxID=693075 RepID=UPI003C744D24
GSKFPMTPPKQKMIAGSVILRREEPLKEMVEEDEIEKRLSNLEREFIKLRDNFELFRKFMMDEKEK